jgi:hypothetical protein
MGWSHTFKLTVYKNRSSLGASDQEIIKSYKEIIEKAYPDLTSYVDDKAMYSHEFYPIEITDTDITFSAVVAKDSIWTIIKEVTESGSMDYKLDVSNDYQSNYDCCYTFTRTRDWEPMDDFCKEMESFIPDPDDGGDVRLPPNKTGGDNYEFDFDSGPGENITNSEYEFEFEEC